MDATNPTKFPSGGLIRRALTTRWREFLAFWFLATVGLGYQAYREFPPLYRASSLIRISPSETDLYNIHGKSELLDQFLSTQVSLITSPNVLTAAGINPRVAVLPRIQVAGDVVLELRKVLHVAVLPNTYLIEVSMTSPTASETATVVNAVVDAFIESNSEWSEGMTRTQIKNLEVYLGDLKNQSDEKERRWRELVRKAESGAIVIKPPARPNLPPGGPAIRHEQAQIEAKRVENDLQRLDAQSRLDALSQLVGERQVGEGHASPQRDELLTKVRAAELLEKALVGKLELLGKPGQDGAGQDAIPLELALVQESRKSLMDMQEQVFKRLEQLKFEAKGEARIRPVNVAVPPGRPINNRLGLVLGVIPFATFLLSVGLFTAVEGVAGPRKPRKPEAGFGAI